MNQTSRNLDAARRRNRERVDAAFEPVPEPTPIEVKLREVMIVQIRHRYEEADLAIAPLRTTSPELVRMVTTRAACGIALEILEDKDLTLLAALGAIMTRMADDHCLSWVAVSAAIGSCIALAELRLPRVPS